MKSFSTLLFLIINCYNSYSQRNETSVWFSFDKYTLTSKAQETLDSIVNSLTTARKYQVIIKGYTDESGTEDYNNKLAQKRAKSVTDFLRNKGVDTAGLTLSGKGEHLLTGMRQNWQKRKATIEIDRQPNNVYSFFGMLGTEVQSADSSPVTIKEYFTTESMLEEEVYAISADSQVLITGGMINICEYINSRDKKGNLTIKIPIRVGGVDTSMRVWNEVRAADGQLRWTQSSIALTIDSAQKYYVFKIPAAEAKTCRFINLDKPCKKSCFVYITTYKPFNFKNIIVSGFNKILRFEAKLNDSTWVFSKENIDGIPYFTFNGFESFGTADTTLTAGLSNSIRTLDDSLNEYYYICDTCFIKKTVASSATQSEVEPEAKMKKRKRGFFQRIADLFRRNK